MVKKKIKAKSLAAHEFIGLKARVIKSSDNSKVGIDGKITNETKNTISVEKNGKTKIIPKKEAVIEIETETGKKEVLKGEKILTRPEERIKKFWRKTV